MTIITCPSIIKVIKEDITKMNVDAIVNAANTSLLGGGGVDGAIHRAGGPAILADCRKIVVRQGGCKVGDAVITGAGNLPAKFVIHTVGPVWIGGHKKEAEKLANCYLSVLKLAQENNCNTIAFPAISTGVYNYPLKEATEVAITAIKNFVRARPVFELVYLVAYDVTAGNIMTDVLTGAAGGEPA